jgi:DNA-binding response OmpR family regulator
MSSRALKILILEDNDDLRDGWVAYFQTQGHSVRGVALADELLDKSGYFSPDVYVIDLNLPDADGLEVVQRLRGIDPDVGIVITTARTQIGDKVLGYDSGADIYFTKPVDPQELMAGISALGKRRDSSASKADCLYLHLQRHKLKGPVASADLTPGETTLLAALVRAAGQPLARWRLAELLGAGEELPSDAMLEMRMARLRRKLTAAGAEGPVIRAVHKQGYVLTCRVVLHSG